MRSASCAATLAAVMAFGATGLATGARAANDGALDGVWATAKFKSKVNLVDYTAPPPFSVEKKVKLETPKDLCYVALDWEGEDSYAYTVCSVCQDASGDWDWVSRRIFREIGDEDDSIALGAGSLCFVADGDDFNDPREYCSEGFLQLTPKIKKDGEVTSLKLLASKGKKTGAYRLDEEAGTEGTGIGKLQLKVVDQVDVPTDAQGAFGDCIEVLSR